jgi:EAL domain-containing protein (putative c-di-GMP-specific phosphodiesterase class I)/GGDEF domain-containing protein
MLLSRSDFISTIKQACKDGLQHSALIFVEINHVTEVISLMLGIEAEERLIQKVEQFVLTAVADYSGSIVGKLESNRFGILLKLPVSASLEIAGKMASDIDQQTITIDQKDYYPKLIIGVTPLTPEYSAPELAFAAADEALYQARRAGDSIVELVEPDNPALLQYQKFLKLLPLLRKGLINKSFVLYAQPIVAIINQDPIKKAEVLLRYQDDQVAIHLPEKFLSTAGLFHISREIDLYVVHHFCRFMQQTQNKDRQYAINISGNTVRYSNFYKFVENELKRFDVNPQQVCFEMTENVADKDTSSASALMSMLKNQLGCKVALDDIGIGSSNLTNLPKFDVDYLKIDGSYISDMLNTPYAELVIRFITAAAKQFGRKTIAEYVENQQQLDKLKDIGVDYAQGYLLGRPKKLFDPRED